MENFESKSEKSESMPCGYAEKPIAELKKEGWVYAWSFHANIPEQWNDACGKVKNLQGGGDWEVVLVGGQDEMETRDGVTYIYKRKTSQRIEWEKEKGYL